MENNIKDENGDKVIENMEISDKSSYPYFVTLRLVGNNSSEREDLIITSKICTKTITKPIKEATEEDGVISFDVRLKLLDSPRNNGFVQYSFEQPDVPTKKFSEEKICSKEEFNEYFDRFKAALEKPIYHLAKGFYHIHEADKAQDGPLKVIIKDSLSSLMAVDNEPLINFLKNFAVDFKRSANLISNTNREVQELEELINKGKSFYKYLTETLIGIPMTHENKSQLLCTLTKARDSYENYWVQFQKTPIETCLTNLANGNDVSESIKTLFEEYSDFIKFYEKSQNKFVEKCLELNKICEKTLIKNTYCKMLLSSKYNQSFWHYPDPANKNTLLKLSINDIIEEISKSEFFSETLKELVDDINKSYKDCLSLYQKELSDDDDVSDPPPYKDCLSQNQKKLINDAISENSENDLSRHLKKLVQAIKNFDKDRLRKQALNIKGSISYIENIKYKNQNRVNKRTQDLVEDVKNLGDRISKNTDEINDNTNKINKNTLMITNNTVAIRRILVKDTITQKKITQLTYFGLVIAFMFGGSSILKNYESVKFLEPWWMLAFAVILMGFTIYIHNKKTRKKCKKILKTGRFLINKTISIFYRGETTS